MTLPSFHSPYVAGSPNKILEKIRVSPKKDKPFLLKSFGHQVSGRASILSYDPTTLCKPYVSRELYFYYFLPAALKDFTPNFRGMINVTFIENNETGSVLTYAQPKSLLNPSSHDMRSFVEDPKPHSKRCVKDYGRTHVIYPSSPVVLSLRTKSSSGEGPAPFDDDVDKLTHGFDANVSIHSEDGVTPYVDERSGESSGLHNPWNSKVVGDAWMKLKANHTDVHSSERHTTTAKTKRFVLLEDVTSPYRRPCVLDLKMGTRVRANASAAKLARHVTAIDIGARLSGMQIYHPERNEFTYVNKYYGHNLSVQGFKSNLIHFFSRGFSRNATKEHEVNVRHTDATPDASKVDTGLVECAIAKLTSLRKSVAELDAHRFYSCSVLLIYEGDKCSDPLASKPGTPNVKASEVGNAPSRPQTIDRSQAMQSARSKRRLCRPRSLPSSSLKYDNSVTDFYNRSKADGDHRFSKSTKTDHRRHDRQSTSDNNEKSHREHVGDVASVGGVAPVGETQRKKHSPKRRRRTKSCGSLFKIQHSSAKHYPDTVDVTGNGRSDKMDVRLIDFAHFCFHDNIMHPGPDGGFLYGIDNVIELLKGMLL